MTAPLANFGELYVLYAPEVCRFSLYLSGDPHLAEEITAETFARAWTTADPARIVTLKAYLLAIARHLWLRDRRKGRKRTGLDEAWADPGDGPKAAAVRRAKLRRTLVALNQLPENDRTALLLRGVDGLPYEEIAALLGIKLAAVKVRIHRARIRLAEILNH